MVICNGFYLRQKWYGVMDRAITDVSRDVSTRHIFVKQSVQFLNDATSLVTGEDDSAVTHNITPGRHKVKAKLSTCSIRNSHWQPVSATLLLALMFSTCCFSEKEN